MRFFMRDLTVVLDTIIKLIPNVVAGEEPENRQALVKRLEKIKSDAVYIAPENQSVLKKQQRHWVLIWEILIRNTKRSLLSTFQIKSQHNKHLVLTTNFINRSKYEMQIL